jgi:hypothetical protein
VSGLEAGDFGGTDRFVIQSRLGSGGYGVVYRAIDRERNRSVALKTLRHVAAKSLIRFKQEFRALADVSHPNLVTLYELSSHEDRWFFTMELVDGVNFLWYVRGVTEGAESDPTSDLSRPTGSDSIAFFAEGQDGVGPPLPPDGTLRLDRLRQALGQLVSGVEALHEAGMLHRDIKPSNVLVTRDGRVVLLDFGLVAEIAPGRSHSFDAVGTPAYMSPEQVADLPLTNASDWYNVGTMLYQALTGQLPFVGAPLDVMRRKQDSDPPPPRALSPDVPADLDALCEALLSRDPAKRPSGSDLRRALSGRSASPPSPPAAAPPAGSPLFVGRETELAALHAAFATVKEGRAITVVVHGSSGMGKSALVRRFLDELKAREPDDVVLAGRCYERESVPYKALDDLVDALSRYLRRLPSAQAEAFLPHDILALARVFPVLRQVSAVNRARRAVLDIPDSLELRRRAFAALRELFVRLADRWPVVLFIDDLQWGDLDSAALLEVLMRPPDPPALMLIGCYRTEEAATSPLLRLILPKRVEFHAKLEMRDILVGELSPTEADALARSLAGSGGGARDVTREAIVGESRGNPYFIEELVRFAQAEESGSSGRGRTREGAPPDVITFDHVIETRVAALPGTARRLLDVVAVAGAPIEVGVADRAADLEKDSESALAALRASHMVRTRMGVAGQEVEPYHDRIREAVVGHLAAEELAACHLRLASALLSTGRGDPERLAMHYLEAGDPESAAEYAATAAAKAAEALAFDRAAGLYRFALKLRARSRAEEARLEVRLGDALANAGRGAEAAEAYLSAAKGSDRVLEIDLHRRAAQQLYTSGHIEEGGRALRLVLARLGMRLPQTPRMALLSLILRRAQVRLRGLRFREREEAQIPGQELLRIDTCWSIGIGLAVVDMVRGADFQARHLVLALRAGEPYRVAKALAMEAGYVAMGGSRSRRRAQLLVQESQALAERVDRPYAVALATLTAGIAAWLDGRWRDARTLCERSEQMLRERCTGVYWEVLITQFMQLASLFFLGEIAALSQRLPSLLEEAEGRGSLLGATYLRVGFCSHVAWLAADRPDLALEEIEAGLSGWRQGRFDLLSLWVRGARTDIALYNDDPPGPVERVGKASRAMARSLDRFVQVGFIRGLDTRARRRMASSAEATAATRDAHLRVVEAHARAILEERTRWGDPLAHVLRAGVAAARGRTDAAVQWLESAEAGFGAADMALHAAAARRRRGELVGGDAGGSLVASADGWMAGQGIRRPERMTAMLAPGKWRAS